MTRMLSFLKFPRHFMNEKQINASDKYKVKKKKNKGSEFWTNTNYKSQIVISLHLHSLTHSNNFSILFLTLSFLSLIYLSISLAFRIWLFWNWKWSLGKWSDSLDWMKLDYRSRHRFFAMVTLFKLSRFLLLSLYALHFHNFYSFHFVKLI